MHQTLTLVSCVSQKQPNSCQAKDFYISDWFRKASAYAQRTSSTWFILSAKYGLVKPDQILAPYDETLNRMIPSATKLRRISTIDLLINKQRGFIPAQLFNILG